MVNSLESARTRSVDWLSRLVSIPSVTPAQAGPRSGPPGEAALASSLAQWLAEFGGDVVLEEVLPGRPNVYAVFRGSSDRWAALDVHLDTAGVEDMTIDPFAARVENGRVYGRGSVDTKASLAVALAWLEATILNGIKPESNLVIAGTVDEEIGTSGAPAFASWVRQQGINLDQLMVAEPTGCTPVYGHKGVLRLEFTVEGKSAHSSRPELGANAVVAAATLVSALDEAHSRLQTDSPDTPLGKPSLTVTIIEGGEGINVVPPSCRVSIDRRVMAGEDLQQLTDTLSEFARRCCPLSITCRVLQQLKAFLQSPDSPWIEQLAQWSGRESATAPFGTNAFAYEGLAQECVVLGPGSIEQAHSNDEWIAISELERLADIYGHWWGMSP